MVNASGGSAAHTEQVAVTVDSALALTDTELDNMSSGSITISGNYSAASGDHLTLSCPGGLSCSGNNTHAISLSNNSSYTNYRTAFRNVQFNTTSDTPSTATRTIQFSVTDTYGRTRTDTRTVTVTAVNDSPSLSGVDNTPTYTEGDAGVVIDGTISISDPDNTNCDQATVSLTTNYQSGEDLLEYSGPLTSSFDSVTGALTLSDAATCATYANELETVTYRNTSEDPNTSSDRTVVFQVRDSGGGLSNADSTTITVQAVSTPPTISGVDNVANYIEDGPAVVIDGTISVTDPDSTDCNQATVDISTNHQPGEDLLEYSGSLSSSFSAAAGTLTLSGTVACATYANELESVTYRNTSQSPSTAPRTVVFQVRDDGSVSSNTDSTTVTVTATNDAPQAVDDTASVPVNSSDNQIDVLANDTDVDAGDTLSLVLVGAPGNGGTVVIGAPCAADTLCYTPPPDFTGVNTFTYTMRDAASAQDSATVTVGGTDADGDGVIDFLDNCPDDANAGQENNDGDSEGDACDTDDDNDGMPDTFEDANGFDPFDDSDAGEDADGDGRTNLEEYQEGSDPHTDDVPPDISGISNKKASSIGYLTPVDLGVASASDAVDGVRTVAISAVTGTTAQSQVEAGLFRPGRTVITWSASDGSANQADVDQTVDVRPLITFGPDRTVAEGATVQVPVMLNGEAPVYPVTVDYTIGGTAGSSDHDAVDGTLSIAAGTGTTLPIVIADDGTGDDGETLVITLAGPKNAVLGAGTVQTLTISEGNVAPEVALQITQGASAGPLITRDNGTVTVAAVVSDPNAGDTFTYQWAPADDFTAPVNGTGTSASSQFEFDPLSVAQTGVYKLTVQVTDSGDASASADVNFKLVETAVALTGVDTDGDGVADDAEGFQDSDGDGIPDYLDAFDSAADRYLVANQTGNPASSRMLQTEVGLGMRLGEAALVGGATGVLVDRKVLSRYVSSRGGSASLSRDTFVNIGGVYDFEIYGMPQGGTARVTLPLLSASLADARYRKFTLQNGWTDFIVDPANAVAGARAVDGVCPGPGHASYEDGLKAFDNCVQLTLQDGGPNDADGQPDGVIRDPGGVAVADVTPEREVETPDDGRGGGGGALLYVLLMLLAAGWFAARRCRGIYREQ